MPLLVVGSIAFDSVETPHGAVNRMLGGAATYVAVAASQFTGVRVVGIVGDDFTREHARVFARRGIDTEGIERAPGKTFFWAGRYNINMNERTTLATELNVFSGFRPKLPPSYRDSRFVFLANIDPTLQLSVLRQVRRRPKLVAMDTMNYWIERAPGELRKVLRHVDILVINDDEARQLAGQHNLTRAAKRIFRMGPEILVIKRGEHGSLMLSDRFMFAAPAFPLEDVCDPTGAGDCFAGGFMGYLAQSGRRNAAALRIAMIYGSVMGSFAVERFGLERIQALRRPEIIRRARKFFQLTQFAL
jgi:sugar/nucleoside kinase (ribokinase family)